MLLSLFHDLPRGTSDGLIRDSVLERLRSLDERARREGLESLDASDPLVRIGMETDGDGRVTKNSYGVFNLAWQDAQHLQWAGAVEAELEEIRARVRKAHGKPPRFLIWAGMGGSIEDKVMYQAAGLLRRGPRFYALDSTDPAKLKGILADIERRSGGTTANALRSTLVVGMAMGMTSYEPVVNLEKLAALYAKHGVKSEANFLYMTLPGSLLDRFAGPRGFRKVELQPDGANSTAGRHSGPLTRGSLYPLGLAGVDLRAWMKGACLGDDDVHTAWKLAAFLHRQGSAGRDKVTLLLPKQWEGAALWTKQDFEESLGKSEEIGIKIAIPDTMKLANYRSPKDPAQDRVFLAVRVKGMPGLAAQKPALLRRAGYPLAVVDFDSGTPLSRYMQFVHYTVFGLGYLRRMNFVTQPGVELYKSIANQIHAEAVRRGGVENTAGWRALTDPVRQARWRGGITLCCGDIPASGRGREAPEIYGGMLRERAAAGAVEYGELTFFGDTRYNPAGRKVRKALERAGERVFRARLKMPVDVYEGPAMNHSYHEMIIGHGRCFSTVLLSEKHERIPEAGYTADYHAAQFLATKLALERRKRAVVAITMRDLGERSIAALEDFFKQAAIALK